jgi:hypothetical protein
MAVPRGTLMIETMRLLKERNVNLPTIAHTTGITFYWLRKFIYGEINDPSVNRVQKLYEYLTDRKLSV